MRSIRSSLLAVVLCGCAGETELTYEPEYLAGVAASYLADTEILILMQAADLNYVFEGSADSLIGGNISLTIPIGAITREIAAHVFQSYFNYGVVFNDTLVPEIRYLVAIEPEVREFSYRYDRRVVEDVIEVTTADGALQAAPASMITPTIQFELALKAYDSTGRVVMEKTYWSGPVSGDSYFLTARPHERVNATFHATLQEMMLAVAEDIRPLLAARPDIINVE